MSLLSFCLVSSWGSKKKKTGLCMSWAVMGLVVLLKPNLSAMETWGSEKSLWDLKPLARQNVCVIYTQLSVKLEQSEVCWVRGLTGDSAQLHVKAFIIYPNYLSSLMNALPLCSLSTPLTHPGCCAPFVDNLFENPPSSPPPLAALVKIQSLCVWVLVRLRKNSSKP